MDYALLAQLAVAGILLGLVYGLVGLGLSLVLGVMNVLSIAHGAVYVLGAYFAFSASLQIGIPPLGAILVGVGGAFCVGLFIDVLISPVASDGTSVSMITFGFAIIVEEVVLLVWGGIPVAMRPIVSGSHCGFADSSTCSIEADSSRMLRTPSSSWSSSACSRSLGARLAMAAVSSLSASASE